MSKYLCSVLCLVLIALPNTVYGGIEKSRTFEFSYEVLLNEVPEDSSEVKIWIPYLPERPYQIVENVSIDSQEESLVTYDHLYNNRILYYSLAPGKSKSFRAKINYKIKRYEISKDLQAKEGATEATGTEDMSKYLKASQKVTLSPKVRNLAKEVTSGKSTDLEKARAIYDYVFDNVSYNKDLPGWGKGDTERVCIIGSGNCTDFHSLFISLARASGIPAKFVIGFPLSEASEGPVVGYHCWAEFYDKDLGWIPVDISEAWKDKAKKEYYFGAINESRLEFTEGRDLILSPEQEGEPLNYFIYPYIEINGKPIKNFGVSFFYKEIPAKEEG